MESGSKPPDNVSGDPLAGRILAGKFRLEALVGRGSMGFVYRATQLNLNKTVAIKLLNPGRSANAAFVHRFKREARAASRLDHPSSVRVIDFGEDGDLLFIAMEFLRGKNLLEILRRDYPLSRERIVAILSQVLAALAVAHEMGVIHRDLKPENIMLLPGIDDEGRPIEIVKVCDFGIAKLVDREDEGGAPEPTRSASGSLTAHGMLIGTPEYMSPEQARGESADARSDIYSLGVILYQLLTGRLPFIATSKIRLVIKHVEEKPTPPSSIDSKVDLGLEAICLRALEKSADLRFQSAREMRVALKASLVGDEHLRRKLFSSLPPPPLGPPDRATAPVAPKTSHPPPSGPPPPVASATERRADFVMTSTASSVDDPAESAAALLEARKLLGRSSSLPPDRDSVTAKARPSHAPFPPIVLMAVVFAFIAIVAYAALR